METNEVFDKVKSLFVEDLGIDESKVTMEAKLEEDLEIDSLGIVEVVMAFEDEFDIEIDDEELADVSTVGEAVKLLSLYDRNCKISMNMAMGNCKKFLKENFDLEEK